MLTSLIGNPQGNEEKPKAPNKALAPPGSRTQLPTALPREHKDLQIPKDVLERLKYTVFGFDTFFVTRCMHWEHVQTPALQIPHHIASHEVPHASHPYVSCTHTHTHKPAHMHTHTRSYVPPFVVCLGSVKKFRGSGAMFKGNFKAKDPAAGYAKMKQRLKVWPWSDPVSGSGIPVKEGEGCVGADSTGHLQPLCVVVCYKLSEVPLHNVSVAAEEQQSSPHLNHITTCVNTPLPPFTCRMSWGRITYSS